MASPHTPGPWVAFHIGGGNWGIRHQSEHRCGGMHADVNNLNRHTAEARDTAESDAHLIAAAPDMLAALRAMVALLPHTDDEDVEGVVQAARAAIAKAEG